MSMEDFGKRLLTLRQNANMTQEELALRMGVTPQAISKWERGQSLPDISIFVQLCRALNVSADTLLGLESREAVKDDHDRYFEESFPNGIVLRRVKDDYDRYFEETLTNLRFSLEPLALLFGTTLIQAFLDGDYVGLVTDQRIKLSWEGILLPVVRLRDDVKLEPDEFVIIAYGRVLYRERGTSVDENTLEHMIQTLGQVVRDNYGALLCRDLMKELTDNLKLRYPALIQGIIPGKISYGLLQEVFKRFLAHGNSPIYLPRVIESLESALYNNTDASIEQLAEQVCADLETVENIYAAPVNRQ